MIVCNDGFEVNVDICIDFKGLVCGDVEYLSLYVFGLKKMVDLGKGMFVVVLIVGIVYNLLGFKMIFVIVMYVLLIVGFGVEDGNFGNFMG